jgi:hypothetical protein
MFKSLSCAIVELHDLRGMDMTEDNVRSPIAIQIGGDHRVRDGPRILEFGAVAAAAFAVVEMWNARGQERR